jgi:hypothetical protein
VDRLVSASLRGVLEKLQPAIAAGAVNVVSVQAIRDASGERWIRKREQVEAFVERTFDRLSQPGDMTLGLNDTEFVIVQPSVSKATALSISATVLKETLAFFLGKAAREDFQLFKVTAFENGAFTLEAAAGAILDEILDADASAAPPASPPGPSLHTLRTASPIDDLHWCAIRRVRLVSPPDMDLELAISPEPTWNISAKVVASFLLRPAATLAEPHMPARDVCAADLSPAMAGEAAIATLAYAAELIADGRVTVALHAPVALAALTYSNSRFRILNALRGLPTEVCRRLILEIVDLPEGLPQSRLTEMVSMLAPHCRAVLARAPSEMSDLRSWRGCGLSGATLDCDHLDPADKTAHLRLGSFARRATEAKLSCVGYSLPSRALIMAAWAAGFTHVGGPMLSAEVGDPGTVRRLSHLDLFHKNCFDVNRVLI